jgi:hypothetical protein
MATCTLQQIYDAARAYLSDTQVPGGEVFPNTVLQPHFAEPYRRGYRCMQGITKRVQNTVYVNLPASTTVLIPSTYGITDFAEPESIEERPAQDAITITSTSNATPINCLATAHGLGSAGTMVEGVVSGVTGTFAPWGKWFATIVDANHFTLNGSSTGGVVGAGGTFTPWSQLQFQEVAPLDQDQQGMDGVPQQYLGVYRWYNNRLNFVGCTGVQQLRIMYWASGAPPTLANTIIGIDDMLDFLACATAANAARSKGWYDIADQLKVTAYGADQEANAEGGLLGEFVKIQVSTMQRGPQRRRMPFRGHRSRFGGSPLW